MGTPDAVAPLVTSAPIAPPPVRGAAGAVAPPAGVAAPPAGNGRQPARAGESEPQSSRPYGAVWRFAVEEQLAWLDSLIARRTEPPPRTVVEAVAIARQAVRAGCDRTLRQCALAWWSGWDAERAWRSVHAAEVELVASSIDLPARLPGIEYQVASNCPAADPRRRELEMVAKKVRDNPRNGVGDRDRVTVAEAMRAALRRSDDALTGVRNLRNRMLVFGTMLGALNLLFAMLAAVWPGWVPLCSERACPTGPGVDPGSGDLATVQLFGGLGALLAVVLLLVHSKPGLLTYQLPGYLSFVKITLGSTIAVVGVLALIAADVEVLIGSQAALLVAALVFGYAQQVATRFLDDYAEHLVGKAKTGADVSRARRS